MGLADQCGALQSNLDEMLRHKPISQTLRVIERKITDKEPTIEGYATRIVGLEAEVERVQQKLQRERDGKQAREEELASLRRDLEETTKGAQISADAGIPQDLRVLPPGVESDPVVEAALAMVQKAANAAREAIKAAKEKRLAESEQASREADTVEDMDLDGNEFEELFDVLNASVAPGAASDTVDASGTDDSTSAKRIELKRRFAAVAKGIVKKKAKKGQQCG
jgi:hypothetical protein